MIKSGPLKKLQSHIKLTTDFWREVILTHGDQVPVVLQHHVPVQGPLSGVQALPLLLRELYGHIPEGQPSLKGKHISPSAQGMCSYLTKDKRSTDV